jgi:PAN domain
MSKARSVQVAMCLFLVTVAWAQTPHLSGWHSLKPLNMTRQACFDRAVVTLRASNLTNLKTLDGWAATASNPIVEASINCVAINGGVLVDVAVAAAAGHANEAAQMRDGLRARFLNPATPPRGGGSGGGTGSGGNPGSSNCKWSGPTVDHGIIGHNGAQLYDITPSACMETCRTDKYKDTCKSVEYVRDSRICNLQNVVTSDDYPLVRYKGTDYYEYQCSTGTRTVYIEASGTASPSRQGARYVRYPGQAIPGHNDEEVPNRTPQECQALCNDRLWCKSFDYNIAARTCLLQSVDASEVPLVAYPGHDHYYRQPK